MTKHNYGATQSAIALFAGFVGNALPAGKVVDDFKVAIGGGYGCDGIYYELGIIGHWLDDVYMAVRERFPDLSGFLVFDYDVSEELGRLIYADGVRLGEWPSSDAIKAHMVMLLVDFWRRVDPESVACSVPEAQALIHHTIQATLYPETNLEGELICA